MKKIIKLYANKGKFINNNEFIKVDNDILEIEVENNFNANVELYGILKNGSFEKRLKFNKFSLEIPQDFIKLGELHITIIIVNNNNEIGRYAVVPLIIKKLDGEIIIINEIEDFKNDIEKIKTEFKRLENIVLDFKKIVKGFIVTD